MTNDKKRKLLEAAGWKVADVVEFLGLTDAGRQIVELRGEVDRLKFESTLIPTDIAEAQLWLQNCRADRTRAMKEREELRSEVARLREQLANLDAPPDDEGKPATSGEPYRHPSGLDDTDPRRHIACLGKCFRSKPADEEGA